MSGLAKDLEDACVKSLGPRAVDAGSCPEVAAGQASAIIDFLKKQTFTITELKAVLEVEKIETVSPLTADVMPTVTYVTPAGAPAPLLGTTGGVLIPKLNLSTSGGQGGLLIATGHAYIGRNPVNANETNENNTQVKLVNIESGSE